MFVIILDIPSMNPTTNLADTNNQKRGENAPAKPNTAARHTVKYKGLRRPNLSEIHPSNTFPRSHPAKMTEDETLPRIDLSQMRSHWKEGNEWGKLRGSIESFWETAHLPVP